LISFLIDFV